MEVFVSGNFRSGRVPKSAAQHKLQGTYRADRHGGAHVDVTGELVRPRGIDKAARWLWDTVVEAYSKRGVLTALDAPTLQAASELWSLYRVALAEAQRSPTDKNARIAVTSYGSAFASVAARLGLNPADRARLVQFDDAAAKDPMAALLVKISTGNRDTSNEENL